MLLFLNFLDVRAVDFLTVIGICPVNSIFNHFYNLRIVIGGVTFMTRLEVEDFTVTAFVATARSEHFTALITSYKYKFVGFGNTERFGIGFLAVKFYITVNTPNYRVGRIAYPKIFPVCVFTPAKRAGSAHKKFEGL